MEPNPKLRLNVVGGPAPLDAPIFVPASLSDGPVEKPAGTGTERTSSYTIYVDLPGEREILLLVHGYTGTYDKVSRRVATWLRSLEPIHAPRPLYGDWTPEPAVDGAVARPSDATIERLRRRGYLTRLTLDEETGYFKRIANRLHGRAVGKPNYVLMPTYQCNLRCPYCFQDHMRTDPSYAHLLRTMDKKMVDRVFAGMAQIDAAHGIPPGVPRNITLFGGEPLLRESRPIVEYILERAQKEGGADVNAISNATELDAYADLLGPGPGKIAGIQVTIDGPPEEHDARRIYPDGSGSFAQIAANVSMALERGANITARMNIDRDNVKRLPEIAAEFERHGWDTRAGFSAYVAPIHAATENVDHRSTLDSFELSRSVEELTRLFPAMNIINTPNAGLTSKARGIFERKADPMPMMQSTFCSAHTTMYVIDAFADVYACWERTGDPKLRIGAIGEDGVVRTSTALLNTWRRRNVTTNEVCLQCRYATYCGGGCAAYAEEQHGHMFMNYCDGFGKRFRESVANAYRDFVVGAPVRSVAASVCNL